MPPKPQVAGILAESLMTIPPVFTRLALQSVVPEIPTIGESQFNINSAPEVPQMPSMPAVEPQIFVQSEIPSVPSVEPIIPSISEVPQTAPIMEWKVNNGWEYLKSTGDKHVYCTYIDTNTKFAKDFIAGDPQSDDNDTNDNDHRVNRLDRLNFFVTHKHSPFSFMLIKLYLL